jgi:hypothetical protein
MSRFDLFYVVLDECDEVVDFNIARHIVNLHQVCEQAPWTVILLCALMKLPLLAAWRAGAARRLQHVGSPHLHPLRTHTGASRASLHPLPVAIAAAR